MIPFQDELNKLKLQKNKFAIFGSAILDIRNIRKTNDLDIIVKKDLWDDLSKKYKAKLRQNPTCVKIGNIEIYKDWPDLNNKINEMIDTAELIENFPFVKLEYLIESKKAMKRPKDLADIKLVGNYLKNK